MNKKKKEYYMKEAIKEATKAKKNKEVPIGAVIVLNNKIIGRGSNFREKSKNSMAHAEILAIQQACKKIGSWRLEKAKIFITLEPCIMCCGALILSRIEQVYFGASNIKSGTAGSLMNIFKDRRLNHHSYVESGILAKQCRELLVTFFKTLRK